MIEWIAILVLFMCVLVLSIRLKEYTDKFHYQLDRANRYYFAVDNLDKWCRYDLPEVEVIVKHLIAEGEGLSMNAGTPAGNEACIISGLREQIRRMKKERYGNDN